MVISATGKRKAQRALGSASGGGQQFQMGRPRKTSWIKCHLSEGLEEEKEQAVCYLEKEHAGPREQGRGGSIPGASESLGP